MPSSRRTTLGPIQVNSGSGSSRMSMGPGGLDRSKKSSNNKAGSRQRKSMAPRVSGGEPLINAEDSGIGGGFTPSRRKSTRRSMGTSGLAGTGTVGTAAAASDSRQSTLPAPGASIRADPRPISDKAYVNSGIRTLMSYLMTSGYDQHALSVKILSRPSGKDFNHIITFLLRKIDPNFNDGTTGAGNNHKFEDEVSNFFRALRYPFNVSKTALVAVGSPHTWPGLLAALLWVIELLQCTDAAGANGEEDGQPPSAVAGSGQEGQQETPPLHVEEITRRGEKTFFKFLLEAYEAFLLGYDEQGEILEDSLVGAFDKDDQRIAAEVERITDLNAGVVETINHMANKGVELPQLEKKREDYCTDLEKFHELIEKLKEHKEISLKKVSDRKAELQRLDGEVQKANDRAELLKGRIAQQGISVDDARRMENEKARLEDGIGKAAAARQQYQKDLWECEMELSQNIEELDAAVLQYNGRLSDLQLFPQSAKNAHGKKFVIDVDKQHAAHSNQAMLLGGIDLQGMVNPHLTKLKDDTLKKMAETRKELLKLLDEEEMSEETLTEARDKLKMLETTKSKSEGAFLREKEDQEGTLSVRLKEIESLETKISSLRDPVALEAAIALYQSQCSELEALRQKHREESISRKKAVQEEIATAVSIAAEHIDHVDKKLTDLLKDQTEMEASLGRAVRRDTDGL